MNDRMHVKAMAIGGNPAVQPNGVSAAQLTSPDGLTHVHEFEGSLMLAELQTDPHNHRFAGVTGPVIVVTGGHVHSVFTRTDFFDDHYHFIDSTTGLPIPVGNGKHVHFVSGTTTEADDHTHDFQVTLLIENPLEVDEV